MKLTTIALVVTLVSLQYKLWFDEDGAFRAYQLQDSVHMQQEENKTLVARNQSLEAEVSDLKSARGAIEERARNELGMMKTGETFYQLI